MRYENYCHMLLFAKYPEADITPEKCLMVGNEYGSDGKVAENAGMNFLYAVSNLTPESERAEYQTPYQKE